MTDTLLKELSPEEEELQQIFSSIQRYPKLNYWVQLFFDKSNKETFGNRTKSAIIAYNLDPITQYATAGHIGWENYKKLQMLAMQYYEQDGLTVDKYLDLIAAKAMNTNNATFAKMLGEIMGVYNSKPQTVVTNNMQQNNTTNVFTGNRADDPEVLQTAKDFQAFIEYQHEQKRQQSNQPVILPNDSVG